LTPLIVGGSPASTGKYPSFAWPRANGGSGGYGLCGAVKIHDDILLTAGHCKTVFKGNDVHLGGTRRSGSNAADTVRAVRERRHPNYSDITLENDFMLVQLQRGVATAVVPNAPYNTVAARPVANEDVTVIGYGLTSAFANNAQVSDALLEVDVKVRSPASCQASYPFEFDSRSMLCASRNGNDSCQGDRCVHT